MSDTIEQPLELPPRLIGDFRETYLYCRDAGMDDDVAGIAARSARDAKDTLGTVHAFLGDVQRRLGMGDPLSTKAAVLQDRMYNDLL